ncbi:MAG: hypothetical protein ABIS08_11445 [Pseudolysinimonas sp.]
MTRQPLVLVIGASLLVILCGCATGPIAGGTPSASSPSSSGAPTPSPAPTRPTLSSLTIGTEGLGDLVIGQQVPAGDPSLAIVRWDENACDGGSAPAAWVAAYPKVTPGPWGGPWPFGINTDGRARLAPITFILVTAPGVGTEKGIRVGSTRDQVLAAYLPSLTPTTGPQSVSYSLTGSAGRLQIEVPFADGTSSQGTDTVAALSTIRVSEAPFTLAGGDGGAPCSG